MVTKEYAKQSDAGRLSSEIVASGKPKYPDAGFRFYGVNVYVDTGAYVTQLLFADDITAGEIAAVDAIVAATIPIPLPAVPIDIQETTIFNSLAIRDTSPHTSDVSNNIGYRVKTLIITNGLNQDVSKQCQGSRDNSTWFNIGDSFTITAGATIYQTCETYFPYIRGVATCSVAPASGTLSMWVEKMGV
jgi:hypothetical protein